MPKSSTQNLDEKNKDFKLPDLFKSLKPNTHLLHLSVLRQLANQRAGTASTKTKGEVRGGGKKPWKQKGTGRARAGSIRSPLWVGGGITFGPKPRTYNINLPKKARNLAIAQALVSKSDNVVLLKSLPVLKEIKTKELLSQLKSMGDLKAPILFIADSSEADFIKVKKASNNLQDVVFTDQKVVGTFEILKSNTILITQHAMTELEKRFSKLLKRGSTKVT
ncbi:MAG: 50S ribosomal protein L4 [Candidatus Melainabacteria bacterium]|nr:50S ribosomal protein L4 [Candidatus Melainabacteria bacterium]